MIYFLKHVETGLVKIGTTVDYKMRLPQLIKKYGDLELLGLLFGSYVFERKLHARFRHLRSTDVLSGNEWFLPDPELLNYIERYSSFNLPLPINSREAVLKKKYVYVPSSFDARSLLRAFANGAGVTYDELFRWFLADKGASMDEKEAMLAGMKYRGEIPKVEPE